MTIVNPNLETTQNGSFLFCSGGKLPTFCGQNNVGETWVQTQFLQVTICIFLVEITPPCLIKFVYPHLWLYLKPPFFLRHNAFFVGWIPIELAHNTPIRPAGFCHFAIVCRVTSTPSFLPHIRLTQPVQDIRKYRFPLCFDGSNPSFRLNGEKMNIHQTGGESKPVFFSVYYEWRDAHPAITSSFFMWTVRALIHRCHRCQSLTGNDRHSLPQRGGKRRWYTMGGLKSSEHKCQNHISAQLLKGFHGKNGMESQENWIGCRVNGFTHCQNVSRNSLVILFRENLNHGFMYVPFHFVDYILWITLQ